MTGEYHARAEEIEILLVGNYADAAYLVAYAREHNDLFAPDPQCYLTDDERRETVPDEGVTSD